VADGPSDHNCHDGDQRPREEIDQVVAAFGRGNVWAGLWRKG
jgi:hypothetical protein